MMKKMISQDMPTTADWHFPHIPAYRAQDGDTDDETSPQADVLVAEPEVAKPPMYAVVMYNDNYTPMTKAKKVNSLAHREGYPLLTQIEPHQGE